MGLPAELGGAASLLLRFPLYDSLLTVALPPCHPATLPPYRQQLGALEAELTHLEVALRAETLEKQQAVATAAEAMSRAEQVRIRCGSGGTGWHWSHDCPELWI